MWKQVLRRWESIATSTEFRCFVRNHTLVAVSQRDHTTFYASLPPAKDQILGDITNFFAKHICKKFSEPDYTFDVYCKGKGRQKAHCGCGYGCGCGRGCCIGAVLRRCVAEPMS